MDPRIQTSETPNLPREEMGVGSTRAEEEHHVGELLTRLGRDTYHLIQQETALARTEIGENLVDAKRGAIAMATSLAIIVPGVTVLLFGAAYGLSEYLELWASMLIVGGAVVLLGVGLAFAGKRQLALENLEPKKFKESLRADRRLLREQVTT
jgi:hypothetical protein